MAQTAKEDSEPVSLVSFVVPAWNEEALLGRTLKDIFAAAQPLNVPFEVVVADDASTDRTAEIAREHGARVVSINRRQIAATRNAGARVAQGDLLIFVDADTLVTPEVIRAAIDAIQTGAVGGGCAVNFDGRVPGYARRLLPFFIWVYRMAGLAAGCFLFCRRRAFDAVGGFDEKLYASEECWMSWALRRQGRFVLLRETVMTSGRKLRTYTGGEILKIFFWLTVRGRLSKREQRGMEIWYGPRRPDPDPGS